MDGFSSLLLFFVLFKQKTAYEMRISDWSSDVCSSDLDTLPEASQSSFPNAVVKDIDTLGPTRDTLVDQWSKGDPDALAATMNESMEATPDLAKTLLFDRNANWAGQLQARMDQPGTVFVAVGAGHLAGQHSVQDYLKERGLTVTRVDY